MYERVCGSGGSLTDPEHLKRRELNYTANKGCIRESADTVEKEKVAWLVDDGPALRKNIEHIGRIGTGAVVGVNGTARLIATEQMKYLFCNDCPVNGEEFPRKLPETIGVFDVAVDPAAHGLGLKREVWFVPVEVGTFYETVLRDFPDVARLEEGPGVVFAALGWIVRILRAKTIVLVGIDCAFTDSWRRFEEPLEFDREEEYLVAADIRGRAVMTNGKNLETAEWLTAAFWFLREGGVRVINASEGGLLRDFVEVRGLAETVDELNGTR
jgi:hypothetical protein